MNVRTSVERPVMAAATAITGLIRRRFRPPCPWRPSKLRFDVEALSLPRVEPMRRSIATHMEHQEFSPLKARGLKDAVETFGFRLAPHVR